jgi:hypothetical protein
LLDIDDAGAVQPLLHAPADAVDLLQFVDIQPPTRSPSAGSVRGRQRPAPETVAADRPHQRPLRPLLNRLRPVSGRRAGLQGSRRLSSGAEESRYSKSIGHQHVLEPDLRTKKGAHDFAQHLLTKAAERLRRGDYYCRRLGVHLSWVADLGGWWDETDFHETRDTGFLLARLEELWRWVPQYKPLSVGVVLLDLVPDEYGR